MKREVVPQTRFAPSQHCSSPVEPRHHRTYHTHRRTKDKSPAPALIDWGRGIRESAAIPPHQNQNPHRGSQLLEKDAGHA